MRTGLLRVLALMKAPKTPRTKAKTKFYAVRRGRRPGVYDNWVQTSAQVHKFRDAEHKSFATREDALRYLNGNSAFDGGAGPSGSGTTESSSPSAPADAGSANSVASAIAAPHSFSSSSRASSLSLPTRPSNSRSSNTTLDPPAAIVIHIDGSSLSNGMRGARAGIGIFYEPGHPLNAAEPLPEHLGPQTNNRAELYAVFRALEMCPYRGKKVLFKTDSSYTIKVFTEWLPKWRGNGMRKADGKEVENRELIEMIQGVLDRWESEGGEVLWSWVKGHSNDRFNDEADRLAKLGASGTTSLGAVGDLTFDDPETP